MDPRFFASREELHDVQMDLRKVHSIQREQSERLRLLEKRQADDAALKSVWNSPFPSVLGGTPQHGPVHTNELFNDLEEQGHSLLNSLHLEADDEPARKGAASRANSVRFDVSALHGSNWSTHGGRHSGEFTPIRPGSELGGHQMMERSLSHKSDGRHSSAGFSVHSAHSGVSGRASSLGLDTNFSIGGHDDDDDSPIDAPEPPPGFYYLGSPPSIIRCWLTTNFTSSSLLYAVVCTGSQRTTVEYSLLKDLDLLNNMHREEDGVCRIRLPVFLAEARVTHSKSRSASPAPQLPSITASFEVTSMDQGESTESKKGIRVVIGCETLRMHSADLLLSQNSMTLYGNDRDKLSVPFVRPEDDSAFKYLTTANLVPGKQKLNAAAREFVLGDTSGKTSVSGRKEAASSEPKAIENGSEGVLSPASQPIQPVQTPPKAIAATPESGAETEKQPPIAASIPETSGKESSSGTAEGSSHTREHNNAAIRTPWRQTAIGAGIGGENGPLSGYQPATRPRNMKVLRPNKPPGTTSSTSARKGAAYEPAPPPRSSSEYRRRSQAAADSSSHPPSSSSSSSWGNSLMSSKRSVSSAATTTTTAGDGGKHQESAKAATQSMTASTSGTSSPSVPRTANNPLGGATAFSWIAQSSNPSTPATADD
ncbi:hypothetical protein V8F33_008300 [Rhypophila sp. PSN 637]